jgi:predicted flap endonuclease-1-like 5' DNA nuclease
LRYVNLQGKAIWALGFFSFLSGLNAVTAIFLAIRSGIESDFQPYLIGTITGPVPIYYYLIASIVATLLFLGGTAAKVVTELSNKALLHEINSKANDLKGGQKLEQSLLESLKSRVFLVDESLDAGKRDMMKKFDEQDKEIKTVHTNLSNRFDSKLASASNGIGKQVGDGFNEQAEMLKEFHASLVDRFDTRLSEVSEGLTRRIAKMEGNMQKYSQRVKKSTMAIEKQQSEIANMKMHIATLEEEFVQPKPQLTSESKTEDVRGIGENTGNELREMGITNVGELVVTDPKAIAEKTDMSEKTVEKLQGRAQLQMVPGINEKDLILLEEAGIMNRQDLAKQDPIDLGKKINAAYKIYVAEGKLAEGEKPTIEEIDSWIKFVKA